MQCLAVDGQTSQQSTPSPSRWERSTEEDRSQVEGLQAAFKEADKDGNGEIDLEELSSLLQNGGNGIDPLTLKWLSEAGISSVMDSFDQDKSGGISFDEFTSLARAGALLDGKFLEYREAWQKLAGSENGTLGASQIQQVFKNLGNPLSENKLWKIFDRYDTDKNGRIDFPEFLELFRDELLDLHTILEYLEMNPLQQAGQAEAGEAGQILAELGSVTLFFSQAELDLVLEEHSDRLVVVEASLTWCRPCKGFEKTFQKFAAAFSNTLFLKFYGNSNENCKHLLEERLQVPYTPTFCFFRKGAQIANVTGTNRGRLYAMLLDLLKPEESPLTQMNTFQQQVWRSKLGLG